MNSNSFEYDGTYEECPVCGTQAFMREDLDDGHTHVNLKQDIDFYSCSLCGYTKQEETVNTRHGAQVVEVYDVDAIPPLVRRAEGTDPDTWKYFLGDEEVGESRWRQEFEVRKKALQGVLN